MSHLSFFSIGASRTGTENAHHDWGAGSALMSMASHSTRSLRIGEVLRQPTTASRSEKDRRVTRSKRWKRDRGTQERHVNAHARNVDDLSSPSHCRSVTFMPATKSRILSQTSTGSRGPPPMRESRGMRGSKSECDISREMMGVAEQVPVRAHHSTRDLICCPREA